MCVFAIIRSNLKEFVSRTTEVGVEGRKNRRAWEVGGDARSGPGRTEDRVGKGAIPDRKRRGKREGPRLRAGTFQNYPGFSVREWDFLRLWGSATGRGP